MAPAAVLKKMQRHARKMRTEAREGRVSGRKRTDSISSRRGAGGGPASSQSKQPKMPMARTAKAVIPKPTTVLREGERGGVRLRAGTRETRCRGHAHQSTTVSIGDESHDHDGDNLSDLLAQEGRVRRRKSRWMEGGKNERRGWS